MPTPETMPFTPRETPVEIETGSGTVTYRIKELLASERNILMFETGKMLGESSGAILEGYLGNLQSAWTAGLALNGVYKNSSPKELDVFIRKTIHACVVTPAIKTKERDNYDMHFCQYYDHQWPLMAAIYEHNFGGTILELKKKLTTIGILTPKSSSQTKSQPDQNEKAKVPPPPEDPQKKKSGKVTPSQNF
jgi:hypothetical protein